MDTSSVINSVKKTHHVVIVEEDWPQCGIGAQIADQIQLHAFDYLDAPILRVTLADCPMPYSKELEQSALPDEAKVIDAVRIALQGAAFGSESATSI
jgi:pyruvate dehydrogenase E1 component beta subunit